MSELLYLEWLTEGDVFALRQRGREVAAALGLERQDQVRLATALSEVGREVLAHGPASVRFTVDPPWTCLVITVRTSVPGPGRDVTGPGRDVTGPGRPVPGDPGTRTGLAAAGRLLDDVTVEDVDGAWTVRLTKRLTRSGPIDARTLTAVRTRVAALRPATPLEELRTQNAELVHTLEQLTVRQRELLRANEELAETNRGVLALYTQLSQELEDTNRGVVALYAELDDKGRQLVEASEVKSRFLRSIGHELRTPVNSILGLTDLLAESDLAGEQRLQVDYLCGSARSLLGLVNELLHLARAESGRQEINPVEVDLVRLFSDLGGTMGPVAEARQVRMTVERPQVTTVVTDPELLTRVLRNLLMNAVKFSPRGEVRMTAVRGASGQHLEIAVSDTGIGIPADLHGRIFEEFYQVPGELQRPDAGSGLGLAYARQVTHLLGGTLELVSDPGAGSTFTVVLPAPPDEPLPPGPVPADHVLVVDDDAAFRHLLRGMLQGVVPRVSEAGDGEEALRLLRQVPADLVLLDLRMPGLDGPGTMAAMRADPALREIPIVLLTSVDLDTEVRRASRPAAALLAKSHLTRHHLVSLLQQVLGARPAWGGGGE